jgi:hypothetical protein
MHDCGCGWHTGGLEGYKHYEIHYCDNTTSDEHLGSWTPQTQVALDAAKTIGELRDKWLPLELTGEVDAMYGAEWHHAVAHMYYITENTKE